MKIIINEIQLKLLVENSQLVDSLLDKINISGLSSLSSDERKYLNQLKNNEIDYNLEKWLLDDDEDTFDEDGNKLKYDEFDFDEYILTNESKLIRIINKFLDKKPFTNNADWGGNLVWPISGNKFEGIFLLLGDDSVELIKRTLIDEDYYDEILMSAINGRQFYKILMKIKNATT